MTSNSYLMEIYYYYGKSLNLQVCRWFCRVGAEDWCVFIYIYLYSYIFICTYLYLYVAGAVLQTTLSLTD